MTADSNPFTSSSGWFMVEVCQGAEESLSSGGAFEMSGGQPPEPSLVTARGKTGRRQPTRWCLPNRAPLGEGGLGGGGQTSTTVCPKPKALRKEG